MKGPTIVSALDRKQKQEYNSLMAKNYNTRNKHLMTKSERVINGLEPSTPVNFGFSFNDTVGFFISLFLPKRKLSDLSEVKNDKRTDSC